MVAIVLAFLNAIVKPVLTILTIPITILTLGFFLLVINALKHAFPDDERGSIIVRYESSAATWRLSVCDDGVGITAPLSEPPTRSGLGTSIVEALTRQLGGRVMTSAASPGTIVSVTVPKAV